MNSVLVTGAHGYIGSAFMDYIMGDPAIVVRGISLQGESWMDEDFSQYDSVVQLAGIAHRKETDENRQLYYDINRDLAVKVAEKAKREHVKQFVYVSTMAVYGRDSGIVTKDTVLAPKTAYGRSKLQAEELLQQMSEEQFKVCIIRPPMVYGPGCKGNFQKLIKLADNLPVFPKVNNSRSMIYIDNLCEFIKTCVLNRNEGIFCPQNKERISTDEIVTLAAQKKGKKIYLSRLLGVVVCCIRPFSRMADKAFGSFCFQDDNTDFSYCRVERRESILKSISCS